jgi:hypothetical protein
MVFKLMTPRDILIWYVLYSPGSIISTSLLTIIDLNERVRVVRIQKSKTSIDGMSAQELGLEEQQMGPLRNRIEHGKEK